MLTMAVICDDLAAEHAELDAVVAELDEGGWHLPTPAQGWAVRDQISHLAFFDGAATTAACDPDRFRADAGDALADPDALVASSVHAGRAMASRQLLGWWREVRVRMLDAFRQLDPAARLPWYGPGMSAVSFATARLMETWAHGQDVADALGICRAPTDRLRHVAHIGVRALPNSFQARGLAVPAAPVRVELASPSGTAWTWGDAGARNVVRGSAVDFCLVVTQRSHLADTGLTAQGPAAEAWLPIAQAFAGSPGTGRRPGQFPRSCDA